MDASNSTIDTTSNISSTPNPAGSNDICIITDNQDSPWLSKPRPKELNLSGFSSLNLSFICEKDNKLQLIPLRNVKKFVDSLYLKPSVEQWNNIFDYLNARNDDDSVPLDDCVVILTQIFGVELELKGIALDEIQFSLYYGSDLDQILQLKMLKNENKELQYQVQMLKQLLTEERIATCETEKELCSSRKNIQMLLNDKRQLQLELSKAKNKCINEELETEAEIKESQTRVGRDLYEKKYTKKLAITCRLYQISTEKLLEFTKVVHQLLTEYKSNLQVNNCHTTEPKNNLTRKPAKVKRAASIQNITGDVSNYFARKFSDGSRICRAVSVCTVRANAESAANENADLVERLANKAKEISTTIESILSENAMSNFQQEKVEWV